MCRGSSAPWSADGARCCILIIVRASGFGFWFVGLVVGVCSRGSRWAGGGLGRREACGWCRRCGCRAYRWVWVFGRWVHEVAWAWCGRSGWRVAAGDWCCRPVWQVPLSPGWMPGVVGWCCPAWCGAVGAQGFCGCVFCGCVVLRDFAGDDPWAGDEWFSRSRLGLRRQVVILGGARWFVARFSCGSSWGPISPLA